MSSFVKISIDHAIEKNVIEEKIRRKAVELKLGVFFEERYIENFENKRIATNTDILFFDIADTMEFDNCESLVEGCWGDIDDFHRRMEKIKEFFQIGLEFSRSIDFWMGTSGDQESDFLFKEIKIDEFFPSILRAYEEGWKEYHFIPPSVHFLINKDTY